MLTPKHDLKKRNCTHERNIPCNYDKIWVLIERETVYATPKAHVSEISPNW